MGQNRNELAASAFILESDDSIGGCEQAVIATAADVLPRLNTSSTLSDDDRPTGNQLATVALNAKSLGIAITAVTATTLTFFVCHGRLSRYAVAPPWALTSLYLDVGNSHAGQFCTVSGRPPHAFTPFAAEHPDLRPPNLVVDDPGHPAARHIGRACDKTAAFLLDEQHMLEGDSVAGWLGSMIDGQDAARLDSYLPAAAIDDGVHVIPPSQTTQSTTGRTRL